MNASFLVGLVVELHGHRPVAGEDPRRETANARPLLGRHNLAKQGRAPRQVADREPELIDGAVCDGIARLRQVDALRLLHREPTIHADRLEFDSHPAGAGILPEAQHDLVIAGDVLHINDVLTVRQRDGKCNGSHGLLSCAVATLA
ncbi:hypothetical protein D3C85_1141280 [compost metagenome]